MTDKIIDEVMHMVAELENAVYDVATTGRGASDALRLNHAIRAKLREVLERKPMPREEMLKLAYPIRWDDLDDREQAAAIGFGRAVEIYHGIHYQIGAE